jgi:hypothetical protein
VLKRGGITAITRKEATTAEFRQSSRELVAVHSSPLKPRTGRKSSADCLAFASEPRLEWHPVVSPSASRKCAWPRAYAFGGGARAIAGNGCGMVGIDCDLPWAFEHVSVDDRAILAWVHDPGADGCAALAGLCIDPATSCTNSTRFSNLGRDMARCDDGEFLAAGRGARFSRDGLVQPRTFAAAGLGDDPRCSVCCFGRTASSPPP